MEKLREIRNSHNMTLEQLGSHLGKSKQYMSELERGNIRLTYEMAVRIARVFDMTPDDLFLHCGFNNIGTEATGTAG